MTNGNRISIILCTRNRAPALRHALESIGRLKIAPEIDAELIVVDNGSTDETGMVVRSSTLPNLEIRYLSEPKKGKSNALNAGLAHARGDVLLFTDDDVLLAEDWVEQMLLRLVDGGCDVATGKITLASYLMRPWLSSGHRWWLASSGDAKPHEGVRELIGANMGFRRSVLKHVPAFDPELGPGGLGLGEDTLFGWQLVEAGFRIEYAAKATAVHQLDVSRLQRINWLGEARKHGRTNAYLHYHWEHSDIKSPRLTWLFHFLKLLLRRLLQPPPPFESEGGPLWEIRYIQRMEECEQFCLERQRARNYSRRGLTKQNR